MLATLLLVATSSAAAQSCEAGFRLFDHEYLQGDAICIPEHPQNVAALDILSFEFMLLNDIRPAASGALAMRFFATTQPEWLPKFQALTEGLADAGFPANSEVILAAKPDLIIGTAGYYDDNVYDEMAKIAPMVVFDAPVDSVGQDWQPNYDFIADALGMPDVAKALIAEYQARVDTLAPTLQAALGDKTISVAQAVPPDQLGLRLAGSFSGILLNDLGLQQPASQQAFYDETTGFIQVNIGKESWQDADGDYLFVYGVQPSEEGTTEAQQLIAGLSDDPIWNALSVVQAENFFLAKPHWHGFGVLAAHDIMDDLYLYLVGETAPVPDPLDARLLLSDSGTSTDSDTSTGSETSTHYEADEASSEDTQRCEAGFRLLEHAAGADCVPQKIERVVEMGQLATELFLALDYKPVATNTIYQQFLSEMFPELADEIAAMVADLPEYGFPPDPEVLLEADPDIIITHFSQPMLPPAITESIAPEIALDLADSWKVNTLFVAELIAERQAAKQLLADYNARAAVLQELVPELEDISLSVVRFQSDGSLTIQLRDSMSGFIRDSLGLATTKAQQELAEDDSNPYQGRVMQIGLERLDLIDADVILLYGAAPTPEMRAENQAFIESLAENPLYQSLQAVQNDKVFMAGDYWDGGGGIISAHATLDDIFRFVAEVEPEEVAPNPFLSASHDTALVDEAMADEAIVDKAMAEAAMEDEPVATGSSLLQIDGFPAYTPAPALFDILEQNDQTITLKHAYGETAIPAKPQRIFVNDPTLLQILLSLGIKPVAAASFTPEFPIAMQAHSEGVELLLDVGEGINLEQLLNLEPDLIIGYGDNAPGFIDPDRYELMQEIAPTIALEGIPFFYWKEATLELGKFFGVEARAKEVLADYEAKLASYRQQAQATMGEDNVTVLLLFDTTMWLYSVGGNLGERYVPLSPTGWAYRELHLPPAPEVAGLAGEELWAEVSFELIPELKADRLIVFPNAYGGEEIGEGLDDYFDSPLWQAVPSVKNGKVSLITADNAVEGYWTTPYLMEAFLGTLKNP